MHGAFVADLHGSYGTIEHVNIWDRVARYSLDRLYLPAEQASAGDVDYVHGRHDTVGLWRDPSHTPGIKPFDFARLCSSDIERVKASAKQCAYLFDIETHDTAWIESFVHEWRKLRPTRESLDTFEPFQGGLEPIAALQAASFKLNPQLYFGDMREVAGDRVAIDLITHGANANSVFSVYDARHLPANWDGLCFDLENLA